MARATAGLVVALVAGAGFAAAAAGVTPAAGRTARTTISWDGRSFSPNPLAIPEGTSVAWQNTSPVLTLVVRATTANWTFSARVAPHETSPAHRFNDPGKFGYQDPRSPRRPGDEGTVVVTAASPTPSPTHSRTPSPTPAPTRSRSSRRPSTSPTPKASAKHRQRGRRGSPVVPALGPGIATPKPTPPGPRPEVLPAVPSTDPSPTVSASRAPLAALDQPVPARRFGLPAAISAVLIVAVIAAIVRRLAVSRAAVDPGPGSGPAVDDAGPQNGMVG
jgi:plastocyanin